jgi:hypothetical protein
VSRSVSNQAPVVDRSLDEIHLCKVQAVVALNRIQQFQQPLSKLKIVSLHSSPK